LRVIFVGINPGVRSALTGHHFAGYSNRFWKLLSESGIVPEPIGFEDDDRLPGWGYGITNIVPRATPGVGTLRPEEFVAGRRSLIAKIRRFQPRLVAFVGVTVFRAMFPEKEGPIAFGLQGETVAGRPVFLLPNPSGRNANYSYAEMLAAYRLLSATLRRPVRLEKPVSGGRRPAAAEPARS